MKKCLYVIVFLMFVWINLHAKFIDTYVELSPNTEGFLEGYADINFNWWEYLYSGASYTSFNFSAVEGDSNSSSTVQTSKKEYTFTFLKTSPGTLSTLLDKLIGIRFLDGHIGIIGRMVDKDVYTYGVEDYTTNTFFYQDFSHTRYFKPLLNFGASIILGPFTLTFDGEYSPFSINEYVNGYYSSSITNQKQFYQTADIGYESRYTGTVELAFESWITIGLEFEYYRHLGYTSGFKGTSSLIYVSEVIDYTYSAWFELDFLKYKLDLIEQVPVIGLSYIQHQFNPLPQFDIQGYTDERFTINIGLVI